MGKIILLLGREARAQSGEPIQYLVSSVTAFGPAIVLFSFAEELSRKCLQGMCAFRQAFEVNDILFCFFELCSFLLVLELEALATRLQFRLLYLGRYLLTLLPLFLCIRMRNPTLCINEGVHGNYVQLLHHE